MLVTLGIFAANVLGYIIITRRFPVLPREDAPELPRQDAQLAH
jgi:hypothetical protein